MTRKRILPTLTLAATACALGTLPVASARAAQVERSSSGNWSGYVVGDTAADTSYRSVTGSWVQPTAGCSARSGSSYAAFWVGLGGASGRSALEQDGTEVNCAADGTATYYAWYELVPKAPVKVALAVHPGDRMTATTTVNGHAVTETIVNDTTGDTFTRTLTMADPDVSSAEWIAEAPSECQGSVSNCSALPLTNFGKVTFSSASATDSTGHTGAISDGDWRTAALTLDPSQDGVPQYVGDGAADSGSATPTGLTDDGTGFSVSYRRSAETSGESGYDSGYGYGSGSSAGYGYGSGGDDGYGSGGGYGYGSGSSAGYGYGSGSGYELIPYPGGGYVLVYTY